MEQGIGTSHGNQTNTEQEQQQFQEGVSGGKGWGDKKTDTPRKEVEGPDDPLYPHRENEEERQSNLDEDEPVFVRRPVHPLWLLCGRQLVWAASDFGIHAQQREYFRRRVQMLLDFLAEEFKEKEPEELLLALRGFFVRVKEDNKNNEGSQKNEGKEKNEKSNEPPAPGRWLDSLNRGGIVYGKDKILPLRSLRVEKGQGRTNEGSLTSLPKGIEYLWLERELPKHKEDKPQNKKTQRKNDGPLYWGDCKEWLPKGLDAFAKEVNEFCDKYFTGELVRTDGGIENQGLGLANVVFGYDINIETGHHNSIQQHKLSQWKKWWEQKLKLEKAKEEKK